MEIEKITFKKIWGIPETEDRIISLVYDYAPQVFSWLEYITIIASIGAIAKFTNSKTLEYIAHISAMIFYFYTFTIISTVSRHYVQKIKSISQGSKLLIVVFWIFALMCAYGTFLLNTDIQLAVSTLINKPILN
ncbi:MAG: hypothetical protein ACXV9T_15905 [Methylobacter sp.]